MAPKHKSTDEEEVLSETSGITEQPEAPEGFKVSERFQASLTRFAFAHWRSSNQKSKAHGKTTTTRRRPRNQDHAKESDSLVPSSSGVMDLRTRKRSMSALEESPNQSVGRLEPGSPSKKQKRGYAEPSTYAHLRELRDHLRSGLEGESIKSLNIPNLLTLLFSSFLWY
jgi:hypothetical protein